MLQEERQNIILNEVNKSNKVTTIELCRLLDVSLDTVRRDLAELESAGKLVKVHGGAISKTFHIPFQQPQVYAREAKKQIAEKALQLIKDGMVILGGGGTVMLELARMIPKNLKGTFFTVSPLVALEITQRSSVDVVLIGGQLSHDSYICTGAAVISQLADIRADLCLLGANGLSAKEGLTEFDWEVAQVKKALLASSSKTAILSISEKLDSVQKMGVAKLSAVDYLVTELNPNDKKLVRYHKLVKMY